MGGSFYPYGTGFLGSHFTADVSVDEAMRFTAVYAAIRIRSNTIASLPKQVFDLSGKGRSVAYGHAVAKLLKRPNQYQNTFHFWNFVNISLDGWGNAFVIIKRDEAANPTALYPIHASNVQIQFIEGKKWYKVTGTKWIDGSYSDEDMLHFYNYSVNGINGVSPIVYNGSAIQSGIGATNFGNEFFESKGNIKAVLETDQMLDQRKAEAFLNNFNESKKFGNPLLTHGVKWKTVTLSPEAAQMLQTRTFAIQDVARIFGVPPHLLAELSRSTFSNIEHQDIEFVKHYIRPTVKMMEEELDRKLFFDDERMETKMNLDGLVRGDMTARSTFYHNLVLDGVMTRNEVRELENLNPIEGLDKPLYPGNENVVGEKKKEE